MSEIEPTTVTKIKKKRNPEPQDVPIQFEFNKLLDQLSSPNYSELRIDEKEIISKQLALAGVFRSFFIKLAPNIMRAMDCLDLESVARENPEKFMRILRDFSTILVSTSELERKVTGLQDQNVIMQVKTDTFNLGKVDYAKLSDEELEKLLAAKSEEELVGDYLESLK